MGILTRKFAFCAALAIGLGGVGGEIYTSQQAGTKLAEDYGRAAQYEQKSTHNQTPTDAEYTSEARKVSNEDIRKVSHGAVTTGVVLGILCLL